MNKSLQALQNLTIDGHYKSFPQHRSAIALGDIGKQAWNVLKQDLPFPLALIKESALQHNLQWMQNFCQATGTKLCPHGKTTMSPQLFHRQLENGAWGMTVATVQQLRICREHEISRVILANQLIGKRDIEYVMSELERDHSFEFYCLVDSVEQIKLLNETLSVRNFSRPLNVLLEVGQAGGRAGCRSLKIATAVARAVQASGGKIELHGIECYEGLAAGTHSERTDQVVRLLDQARETYAACKEYFVPERIIFTAGGSAYFDLVADNFSVLKDQAEIILRSGCYLTHDAKFYGKLFAEAQSRHKLPPQLDEGLKPALEVWGMVQSKPEPNLAIVTLGKRDVSFDTELPTPKKWFREGVMQAPRDLSKAYQITQLNDQHGYLKLPSDAALKVGDLVGFDISHPCTTFDRWQLIYLVDDDYQVASAIRTFF